LQSIAIASILYVLENGELTVAINSVPQSGSALLAAVQWVEGVLQGSVGTAVAVVAVVWLGFAMLNGQAPPRQAVRVVLGMFILFGAPMIVREIAGAVRGGGEVTPLATVGGQAALPSAPPTPPPFDPYAGAAVPNAQN
jgi:type IV secretory pathway VirB2 component (pilin)